MLTKRSFPFFAVARVLALGLVTIVLFAVQPAHHAQAQVPDSLLAITVDSGAARLTIKDGGPQDCKRNDPNLIYFNSDGFDNGQNGLLTLPCSFPPPAGFAGMGGAVVRQTLAGGGFRGILTGLVVKRNSAAAGAVTTTLTPSVKSAGPVPAGVVFDALRGVFGKGFGQFCFLGNPNPGDKVDLQGFVNTVVPFAAVNSQAINPMWAFQNFPAFAIGHGQMAAGPAPVSALVYANVKVTLVGPFDCLYLPNSDDEGYAESPADIPSEDLPSDDLSALVLPPAPVGGTTELDGSASGTAPIAADPSSSGTTPWLASGIAALAFAATAGGASWYARRRRTG